MLWTRHITSHWMMRHEEAHQLELRTKKALRLLFVLYTSFRQKANLVTAVMRAFCSNLVFSEYDGRNPASRKKKLQEIISILESLRSARRSTPQTSQLHRKWGWRKVFKFSTTFAQTVYKSANSSVLISSHSQQCTIISRCLVCVPECR